MNKETSCLVYKQTILPYFDHIALLIESCTKRQIGKLQPLQNRVVKVIDCRNDYVGTEEMGVLYRELRLEMLCMRRKRFMLHEK